MICKFIFFSVETLRKDLLPELCVCFSFCDKLFQRSLLNVCNTQQIWSLQMNINIIILQRKIDRKKLDARKFGLCKAYAWNENN